MKNTLASVALFLLSTQLLADSPAYSVVQGEAWNVTQANGQAIRSPDKICKDTICYPLGSDRSAYLGIEHKYALRQVDFLNLSRLAVVKARGDRLELPADLGAEIYDIAHKESIRDLLQFDD